MKTRHSHHCIVNPRRCVLYTLDYLSPHAIPERRNHTLRCAHLRHNRYDRNRRIVCSLSRIFEDGALIAFPYKKAGAALLFLIHLIPAYGFLLNFGFGTL